MTNRLTYGAAALLISGMMAGPALAAETSAALYPITQATSLSDVRDQLQEHGYRHVSRLHEKGDKFIAVAYRAGHWYDLRIDRQTGRISEIATGGPAVQVVPGRTTLADVRNQLQDYGYTGLDDLHEEGDLLIANGYRGPHPVRLRIDLQTGEIHESMPVAANAIVLQPNMDVAYVRQQLESLGYDNVDNVEEQGDLIAATARRAGEEVQLRVDLRTGEVREL